MSEKRQKQYKYVQNKTQINYYQSKTKYITLPYYFSMCNNEIKTDTVFIFYTKIKKFTIFFQSQIKNSKISHYKWLKSDQD